MENLKLSEKESLELITRMIQNTKQNIKVGSGNIFLIYGYLGVTISLIVFTLIQFTHNGIWSLLWFLMFAPMPFVIHQRKKEKKEFSTYTDKVITNTWKIIGWFFVLTVLTLMIMIPLINVESLAIKHVNLAIIMPLALIFTSFGTITTGITLKEKALTYIPLLGFIFGIFMINNISVGEGSSFNYYNMLTAIGFFFTLVIPGHVLNFKTKANV